MSVGATARKRHKSDRHSASDSQVIEDSKPTIPRSQPLADLSKPHGSLHKRDDKPLHAGTVIDHNPAKSHKKPKRKHNLDHLLPPEAITEAATKKQVNTAGAEQTALSCACSLAIRAADSCVD